METKTRKLVASILQTGLNVARHEMRGPANYVKIHSSVDIGEGLQLAGMRVERDDTLSGKVIVGRDADNFEIEREFNECFEIR
jgi:hypothetical protein